VGIKIIIPFKHFSIRFAKKQNTRSDIYFKKQSLKNKVCCHFACSYGVPIAIGMSRKCVDFIFLFFSFVLKQKKPACRQAGKNSRLNKLFLKFYLSSSRAFKLVSILKKNRNSNTKGSTLISYAFDNK